MVHIQLLTAHKRNTLWFHEQVNATPYFLELRSNVTSFSFNSTLFITFRLEKKFSEHKHK